MASNNYTETTSAITTDATKLIKTFVKVKDPSPDSTAIATAYTPPLSVNGADFDICYAMFDQDGVIASKEVKQTLAVLVLEAAKALNIEPQEIINYKIPTSSTLSMTAIGLSMINQLRPITSQLGVKSVSTTSAKTALVNRNILA